MTPESAQALLNSDDFGDRIKGINQLRQLDRAAAFKLVQPLINDNNIRVRYAAVSLMDVLGEEDLELSLQLLRDRLLNDPEVDVKAAAADAIAALKITEAFEDLQQVYQQTDEWLLQMSIVAALGEMGDPRGFDLLAEALQSGSELLQTAAIGAFGDLGNKQAIPLLLPYAANPDWQMRYRVAQTLNRLGSSESRSTLEQLAQDEIEQVAQEARKGLGSGEMGN